MNSEVKSAGRVLELIELLARCPAPLALKDVVASLAIPKSSAHGLLQTLVTRGYAERGMGAYSELQQAERVLLMTDATSWRWHHWFAMGSGTPDATVHATAPVGRPASPRSRRQSRIQQQPAFTVCPLTHAQEDH